MCAKQISLKAARVNANLTQKEAAKHLGISAKTLWSYESGDKYPSVPMIKKIEELYQMEYKDIIFLNKNYG